jgi:hypothetical protein
MTIEVSTSDPRTSKALALLETAPTWLKIRRKSDGVRFYVVPGCNGHVYWTNLNECSCPDHQHRGESVTCKHRLAVGLYVAKVRAERQQRRSQPQPPAGECCGCNQERNRRRVGGRRLSQAERSPHSCQPTRSRAEANSILFGHDLDDDEPRRSGPPLVARMMA